MYLAKGIDWGRHKDFYVAAGKLIHNSVVCSAA